MKMMQDLQNGEIITNIVAESLRQETLSGIVEILRMIAEAVDAFGCILWEVAPWAHLESDSPSGKLFVMANWFRDGVQLPLHYLKVDDSANGLAILKQETQNVESFRDDPRT